MPKLDGKQARELLKQIPGWQLDGEKLRRKYSFEDFMQAIDFVNKMAQLAESEGHHPNFSVDYSRVDVTIWTHAIGGLSENDFILAAKIDKLLAH